jgi:hypothetical protein
MASMLFSELTEGCKRAFAAVIAYPPMRPFAGGALVVGLALLVDGDAYLGLSLPLIDASLTGAEAVWYAFALKLLFTVLTLGAGFQGGEVTPPQLTTRSSGSNGRFLTHPELDILSTSSRSDSVCPTPGSEQTEILAPERRSPCSRPRTRRVDHPTLRVLVFATMPPEHAASGPTAHVVVPAELRFLEVIRSSVHAALRESGCDPGCASDLQLACDELAGVLITSARTPSDLRLAVTDDGVDAYVRMVVPVAPSGFRPEVPDLTRMLLDATADSYEVRTDGQDLVGVLQREIASDEPGNP